MKAATQNDHMPACPLHDPDASGDCLCASQVEPHRTSSAAQDHATKLRSYAEQLPTVLSVPNFVRDLFDAADEIDRLNRIIESLLGKDDDAE